MKIEQAGENSIIIYIADAVSEQTLSQISYYVTQIKQQFTPVIIDIIPSYCSILIIFNTQKMSVKTFCLQLRLRLNTSKKNVNQTTRLIELPAYYDISVGPDLTRISEKSQLNLSQVIDIHQQTEYRVYAVGFAPGFAYLGEVDARIAMPRLATPRPKVAKGSIAIADRQTAVYPSESPGGWNIIGRCPISMLNKDANHSLVKQGTSAPEFLLNVGDRVKFYSINKRQFAELSKVSGKHEFKK